MGNCLTSTVQPKRILHKSRLSISKQNAFLFIFSNAACHSLQSHKCICKYRYFCVQEEKKNIPSDLKFCCKSYLLLLTVVYVS